MRLRDAALLILLGAAWGAVYPLTALALRGYPAPAVVAGRTALSAVILVPLAIRAGMARIAMKRPAALAIGAVLQATLPVTLLTLGQQHVASGVAGIILASQPVWAAILTGALDRALRLRELTGVAVGLAGIALLSWPVGNAAAGSTWGLAALVAAALAYAVGAVYIQRVIPDVPPLAAATAAMTVTGIVMIPFAATAWTRAPGWASTGWLAGLAVATGPALVLYYSLIHRIGPVRATLAGYLAPGFALVGSAFLGQALTAGEIAGLVLVLAGSYLAGRERGTADRDDEGPPGLSALPRPPGQDTGRYLGGGPCTCTCRRPAGGAMRAVRVPAWGPLPRGPRSLRASRTVCVFDSLLKVMVRLSRLPGNGVAAPGGPAENSEVKCAYRDHEAAVRRDDCRP